MNPINYTFFEEFKRLSKTKPSKFVPLIIISVLSIALIVFVVLCIFIFLVIYH